MTFDEVLAAARGLTPDEKWGLIQALEEELDDARAGEPANLPPGQYLFPPSRRNGWAWEASPDLLAELQRLSDEAARKEAS